jgi:hypothetical protein
MTTPSERTTGRTTGSVSVPSQRRGEPQEVTGWTGWVAFGGLMMVMVGVFHAMAGLVALFKDSYFLVAPSGLVVNVDYTTWGWVHLVLGVIAVVAGGALLVGQMWARVVGVAFASVSAVVNLAFIAAYPIWSMIMIAIAVIVIYAIVVHGRELKAPSA